MDPISSTVFRLTYPSITEPVVVTVNGHPIGRWVPFVPAEAMAALPDGSNRQVAAVAGVHERTVRRERGAAFAAPAEPDAEPTTVLGADGTGKAPQAGGLLSGRERQHERDALLERMRSGRP